MTVPGLTYWGLLGKGLSHKEAPLTQDKLALDPVDIRCGGVPAQFSFQKRWLSVAHGRRPESEEGEICSYQG